MKNWKPGIAETGYARVGINERLTEPVYYSFHIGSREFSFARGELLLTIFGGLFTGLIIAGIDMGYIRMPKPYQPALEHYDAPKPRLLGSTERTRPEAGNPDRHFVNERGRAVPAADAEPAPVAPAAAAAAAPEPVAADDDIAEGGFAL